MVRNDEGIKKMSSMCVVVCEKLNFPMPLKADKTEFIAAIPFLSHSRRYNICKKGAI